MTAPAHDPSDYALNYWLRHETNAEHAERVHSAEQEVGQWLRDAGRTERAAALYDLSCDEIMRDGQMSEATIDAWNAITPRKPTSQVAA